MLSLLKHNATLKAFGQTCLIFALLCASAYYFCPKPDLVDFQSYSRVFIDRNQRVLRITLADDDRYRIYTPLKHIAEPFQAATLLYEDQHYFHHPGVDVAALFRAFWQSYIVRERRVGGSTIAMQVARLRWRLKTSDLSGKLVQIVRALQISRHYDKHQILEAYFNLASYGRNIEGIGAASLIYFNKKPDQLSLPEALTLAVIPQNPVARNPTTPTGLKQLHSARERLFQRWLAQHPEAQAAAVLMQMPLAIRAPEALPFHAPHFVTHLDSRLPWLRHGIVETTLDLDLQHTIETIIDAYLARRRPDDINNAVAMLVDYRSMQLTAMIGSADFSDPSIAGQVNGALAKRSPGSTLKPFVYALAMDQGLIHPMTLLKDAPKRFAGFTPENFDQRFLGPIMAGQALITSRNVPAVSLQSQLKKPGFYRFLTSAGVSALKPEAHYGLSLALGGGEVTMSELIKLYAMLANGGALKPLQLLSEPLTTPSDTVLLSPEASFLTLDILRQNPPPMGLKKPIGSNQIAWKTGTSFAYRDAWAVGVSGPYVLAVWLGNFQGWGNPALVGSSAAGPLLFEIFAAINRSNQWRIDDVLDPRQLNLRRVPVCSNTGDLPGRACPNTTESWFIPGVSPIKVSNIHRTVAIDPDTGLRTCWPIPGVTNMQVYEFWPSDLLQIFRQAGVPIKSPPAFAGDCRLDQSSATAQKPIIQSPQSNMIYVLNDSKTKPSTIPLSAIVDADVEHLYWFIDNRYLGKRPGNQALLWPADSGRFSVRAVDDQGRSSEVKLIVKQAGHQSIIARGESK